MKLGFNRTNDTCWEKEIEIKLAGKGIITDAIYASIIIYNKSWSGAQVGDIYIYIDTNNTEFYMDDEDPCDMDTLFAADALFDLIAAGYVEKI